MTTTLAPPTQEASGQHLHLLDGGAEAFPRMLAAIDAAARFVHLEVYTFELDTIGTRFLEALEAALRRGVRVHVLVDGWGTARDADAIRDRLRAAGARVRVYNPLRVLPTGRSWRNHRKILLVDGQVAFIGGINIGDAYAGTAERPGWADLALELRGEVAAQLESRLHARASRLQVGRVQVHLAGFGGGLRLEARYRAAIESAREQVTIAHAYFLPEGGLVRALARAAARGVRVRLLLAGRSDVPLTRLATGRLYRKLLQAGVSVHEWECSILHAKAAVVDGRRLLVGSFNLDPLSLVNLETLVEVDDAGVAAQGDRWMERHLAAARTLTLADLPRPGLRRWVMDLLGLLLARLTGAAAHLLGWRLRRRPVLPRGQG
ncbi:cardiolipin synthase B [Aggregicoccus sp. 17bor-14]|uniref:phospholipase D-like domain-containing protein n=1 Tax=Myxococcaceae TaxID=31 RepID=UPI00129C767C|nr:MULTISPECIES: phosphatidylserine/phosphatidylglycerophosphate/cardiolipin synthase family protein [Myxococcaceae]MBF5045675.1 cardiolipin synthase B [Simulacricoccus sp. 17bor-14]MRI91412.1 cardiolipin synthase B [Aggregicoccus sp. 17bor-14]